MISKQGFKIIMDYVWQTFKDANTAGAFGVAHDREDAINIMHIVRDKAEIMILSLFGIDRYAHNRTENVSIQEKLDGFLCDVSRIYPDSEEFPESCYPELFKLLASATGELLWKEHKNKNGRSIGGAYWNEARFGPFNDRTIRQLQDEGFAQYDTKRSYVYKVAVWAHSYYEACKIGEELTEDELDAYGALDHDDKGPMVVAVCERESEE